MTRIYRYILETDGGMAPCPQNGLVTLATCKPTIRRMARKGDWVGGFMPGSNHRGKLVWAGRISAKLSHDEYQRRHPHRRDAIYKLDSTGNYTKRLRGYHCDPKQERRDYGNPVLMFADDSWYFGCTPQSRPETLKHLDAAGQGYRVNFRQAGDLAELVSWLNSLPSGIQGTPRDEVELCPGCQWCSGGDGSAAGCGRRRSPPKPRKLGGC